MDDNNNSAQVIEGNLSVEAIRDGLEKFSPTTKGRIFEKIALAALSAIPWVGGFVSAAASFKAEEGTIKTDGLQTLWLKEHEQKINDLLDTLNNIASRFETLGSEVEERIQTEEYLALVRKSFKVWDEADTSEKRRYIANLITNAGGTKLCSDDLVRLFIDWIEKYHESHFAVMRAIYKNSYSTRYDIWIEIHGELVREDSAEADLFKLLIRDLSTGGVIRQQRAITYDGQFLKRKSSGKSSSSTMESAFEDSESYVLTELGKQFVHYTMNEVVQRINRKNS